MVPPETGPEGRSHLCTNSHFPAGNEEQIYPDHLGFLGHSRYPSTTLAPTGSGPWEGITGKVRGAFAELE